MSLITYLVLEKRIEIDNSIKLKAELQSIIPELRNSTYPLKAVKRFIDYRPGIGRGSFLDFRTRLADKIQELAKLYGPEFMKHEIKRVDRHYMTTD